ncbi:KH domain-containing protein [Arthrobacter sp. zg-Y895]|uniref:KH domain-containing protein n=1 Tax=Arthrobacter sp. zg-Y895 TaxID=2886933 RepID=UPI001D14D69F|nr:KH domain-containing protein [Arthrobacter sp. zg-Y895]MCC3300679.1 KH domain-containing protein [Arthrobacter sp. zg-Y895]
MYGITSWLLIGTSILVAFTLWLFTYLRSRRSSQPRLAVPPIYTNHAKERMLERQVRQHQIEQVIAKPSRTVPDRQNGSVRLERELDGRVLKVWVVAEPWETAKAATVKTTAWADLAQTFEIPPGRAGLIIGPGGSTVRGIEAATDTRISVDRTGSVRVSADSMASLESAKQKIHKLIEDAVGLPGSHYRAA